MNTARVCIGSESGGRRVCKRGCAVLLRGAQRRHAPAAKARGRWGLTWALSEACVKHCTQPLVQECVGGQGVARLGFASDGTPCCPQHLKLTVQGYASELETQRQRLPQSSAQEGQSQHTSQLGVCKRHTDSLMRSSLPACAGKGMGSRRPQPCERLLGGPQVVWQGKNEAQAGNCSDECQW